jgi:pimeloyl-ACP methyl ester carboxylesterase
MGVNGTTDEWAPRSETRLVRGRRGAVGGSGPPLILIDAAGHFRANSPFGELADRLATGFTVVRYDRRGRGGSTDTPPYARAREVEDLAALIDALDRPTAVYAW